MRTTVRGGVTGDKYALVMDQKIDHLRKNIWVAIHRSKGDLSACDIAMALGIVQYELTHHSDEISKAN